MYFYRTILLLAAVRMIPACSIAQTNEQQVHLTGQVHDQNGDVVVGATVRSQGMQTTSDASGHYDLPLSPGLSRIEIGINQETAFHATLDVQEDRELNVTLRRSDTITVRAEQDALTPDPATQGYSHSELLDANPGRPGVPVSIPGYPTETASGGIKAPQYFLGLDAKAEFEYVKAKPLGDGFNGVPVREIRLAINRSFVDGRWVLSLNGQLNNGYSGQTLETLAVGSEPAALEQPVGVPMRSYGSASLSYFFGH